MNETQVTVVKILPTKVWIESDFLGDRHVVLQHEGMNQFTYATFFYNYAYTDNATTRVQAEELAVALGAEKPIEHRNRPFDPPAFDSEIESLRTDAERYRWLRTSKWEPRISAVKWTSYGEECESLYADQLDAAIDAARKERSAS